MYSDMCSEILSGRVLRVCPCSLLVLDSETSQAVQVLTSQADCFPVGSCVRVAYDGAMTRSIPPQINADRICRACNG